MKGIPEKLRSISDEFLKSRGIDQKVASISILDDEFQKEVQKRKRSKTKAAEVEHAIRHYIDINISEDPELFLSFSDELDRIFQEFQDNWDKIYEELEKLRQRIRAKEQEYTYGLDRKKQMPLFRIFKTELFENRELNEDEIAQNVNLTQHTFNHIAQEVQAAGFWSSIPAQNRLKAELQKLFLSEQFVKYPNILSKRKELISRLMEWARENHGVITQG
jgi:type I restriction enzyme R subunit